jgi:chloramphenicol-sensitive protein RarD
LAYLLAPLLTAILAVFIHRDFLKKEQKIAFFILCFSCLLLSLNHSSEVFWAMGVALFYAIFVVFQKWILMLDRWTVLFFNLIMA